MTVYLLHDVNLSLQVYYEICLAPTKRNAQPFENVIQDGGNLIVVGVSGSKIRAGVIVRYLVYCLALCHGSVPSQQHSQAHCA